MEEYIRWVSYIVDENNEFHWGNAYDPPEFETREQALKNALTIRVTLKKPNLCHIILNKRTNYDENGIYQKLIVENVDENGKIISSQELHHRNKMMLEGVITALLVLGVFCIFSTVLYFVEQYWLK